MSDQPHPEAKTAPPSAPVPAQGTSEPSVWSRRTSVFWREWLRPLLIIGLVMFSFRSAVADWNDVPTGSMIPTILEGDRIFINKVAYDLKFPFTTWRLAQWADPQWGDVVVLRSPVDSKRLVKRVVGLPGDEIVVLRGQLYVNGEPAAYRPIDPAIYEQLDIEPAAGYEVKIEEVDGREHPIQVEIRSDSRRIWRSNENLVFEVPPEHFFMMGDNRDNSNDSRVFGAVHRSAILGQATAVALSVNPKNSYWPRWKRFFTPLL